MKALCRLLLPVLLPLYAFAQVDTAAILHPTEDFVTVSVCVASPGEEASSSLGHACLRLQCPSADLDYVYSYEAEDPKEDMFRFFTGKLKMLVLAVPSKIYVAHYAQEGRGVEDHGKLPQSFSVIRRPDVCISAIKLTHILSAFSQIDAVPSYITNNGSP